MAGERRRQVPTILVNEAWCKRCGICVYFCPTKVFDAREDGLPLVARGDDCIWCGLCEVRCPDFAIVLKGDRPGRDGKRPAETDPGVPHPKGGEPVAPRRG